MSDRGFSLIEALVALLILAIASAGLVRAAEAHVDSVRDLEQRTAAGLVASNRLVELGLPGKAVGGREVEMLGQRWTVAVAEETTTDPDLRAVTVSVAPAGAGKAPLASLHGFVDRGAAQP